MFPELKCNKNISTKIITDGKSLIKMEKYWNRELATADESPFLYSRMLSGILEANKRPGWNPLLIIFLANKKIIGIAPLKISNTKIVGIKPIKILRKIGSKQALTLEEEMYSDIIFKEKYRDISIDKMIKFLFNRLKCQSVSIIVYANSPNLKVLKEICLKKQLNFNEIPQMGEAILPIKKSWDIFKESLGKKFQKRIWKIKRKLEQQGHWEVCVERVTTNSIAKVLEVEKTSWKSKWRTQNQIPEEIGLKIILSGSKQLDSINRFFESEIWFLKLNGNPIAYQLVLSGKETSFFVKTSYNSKFRDCSPGIFIVNAAIKETFKRTRVKKISFITNLPFMQLWKPTCRKRKLVIIKRNSLLAKTANFASKNPLVKKIKFISNKSK